jgi:hypothetical protein
MPNFTGPPQERLAQYMEHMARGETVGRSPLYVSLFKAAAIDVRAGGPTWTLLEDHSTGDNWDLHPGLKLFGAVHHLVLEGRAPELEPFYASVGDREGPDGAWPIFRSVLESEADAIRALLPRPIQTNEVGRCAALVGGFLEVARSGLPLRILEIGSSAGLNLRWDRYRYEARGATWGPEDSPVRLCSYNTQQLPPFDIDAEVVERRGCDPHPIDPRSEDGRLTLRSFVWPDQVHRHRLLHGALEVAAREPAEIDRADATEWLPAQLAEPSRGSATVVFHSIVMQYLSTQDRDEVRRTIEGAGASATQDAPLAWLRMEPAGPHANVELTIWPGGEDRLVARSGYHGDPVEWLGGPSGS